VKSIAGWLGVEALAFFAAALVHGGVGIRGYEHPRARIAESVIGVVLTLGLAVAVMRPQLARSAGLAAQGFALLGTLVGAFTIAVGVGPRTLPDVVYHVVLLALLTAGLVAVRRAR